MSIVYHERPGVYVDLDASAVYTAASGAKTIAVAGISTATAGLYTLNSFAGAEQTFGESSELTALLRLLFCNGAARVLACPVATGTLAEYEAAFSLLFAGREARLCVIGSNAPDVQQALKAAVMSVSACKGECIALVGMGAASVEQLTERAAALDCPRMVLLAPRVYPAGAEAYADGCMAAAALAGLLATQSDPALPLNGAVLKGLSNVETVWTEEQLDTLLTSGVTALECVGGEVCVIRALTTSLTVNEQPNSTWRELSTLLVADDVIPSIRAALQRKFSRAKNNALTRSAIRNQIVVELESRVSRQIIDSYEELTVGVAAGDPTVCEARFAFTVTHGLNRIHISANLRI